MLYIAYNDLTPNQIAAVRQEYDFNKLRHETHAFLFRSPRGETLIQDYSKKRAIQARQIKKANAALLVEAAEKRIDRELLQRRSRKHFDAIWKVRSFTFAELLATALIDRKDLPNDYIASGGLLGADRTPNSNPIGYYDHAKFVGTWATEAVDCIVTDKRVWNAKLTPEFHEWAETFGVTCRLYKARVYSRSFVYQRKVCDRTVFAMDFPTEMDAFAYRMRWAGL